MKTYAEQVKDLENTRGARVARMEEIAQKAMDEDRSMDAAEAEEFDEVEQEIKQLDEDITRYRKLHKQSEFSATPVEEKREAVDRAVRGPTILTHKKEAEEAFEGQFFTRKIIARAIGKMDDVPAWRVAENRWGKSNPRLVEVMKADVAGGGTGSGEWGAELVGIDNRFTGDFIDFLYSMTVYNQLPLRQIPAHVAVKGQDGAATGYWVGESKAIPMSKPDYSNVELTPLKVAALTTMSKELMRHSSPSAEMLVRDALVEACSQRIDTTFISNSAAVAGSTPAGILNNIAATTSAGTDTDSVLNDIKELRYRFITAKNSGGLFWVMNPSLASSLSLIRNALGQKEFTEINQNGGRLEGDPVVVGHNVNANYLVLVKPSDIFRIEGMSLEVSVSEHATIEQANNPAGATDTPVDQAEGVVGMFQTDSMAIKAVMPINFARRRTSAVAWISDADYGAAIST